MKNWWLRYLSLSKAERSLFWQSLYWLCRFTLALKLLKFARFKVYFSKTKNKYAKTIDEATLKQAILLASSVWKSKFTCLPQALVFKHFTKKQTDYKLVIGINPKRSHKQQLDAHAWIEKNGRIIIGDVPDSEYLPLWIWE